MLKENRKIKGRSEIKEKGARPQPRPGPRPPDRPSPPTTAPGSPLLPVPPTGVATGASPVGPVHRRRQGDKVPGSLFLPCSTHSPRLPSLASQIHALLPLSVSLARLTRAPSPPSHLASPRRPPPSCSSDVTSRAPLRRLRPRTRADEPHHPDLRLLPPQVAGDLLRLRPPPALLALNEPPCAPR